MVAAQSPMRPLAVLLVLLAGLLSSLAQQTNTTCKPRPYKIDVNPKFIESTRIRAANFLNTPNIDAPAWFDGPPSSNITDAAHYWANTFNYTQFQHELNTNFSNYMTTVPPPGGQYNRSIGLHFIHQVSKRKDAIPLLLLHGWPSTSLEWQDVIPGLVNPPNSSLPAFHAIAPDLPGFGFSPAPSAPGLGAPEHATAFVSLMSQLGYDRFAIYSTDLGYAVARRMVPMYPERIINHISDFYLVFPNATDTERFNNNQTTPAETAYLTSLNSFFSDHGAYATIHSTLPLSLAYALYDSPVGFLAWVYQLFYTVTDVNVPMTAEALIRRTLGLYIPGPYNNIRSYKELYTDFMAFTPKKNSVPTSVTQWGGNVGYPILGNFNFVPFDWVERTANVTYFKKHPTVGGHFPAEAQPKMWLQDMWEIFAQKASRV